MVGPAGTWHRMHEGDVYFSEGFTARLEDYSQIIRDSEDKGRTLAILARGAEYWRATHMLLSEPGAVTVETARRKERGKTVGSDLLIEGDGWSVLVRSCVSFDDRKIAERAKRLESIRKE